MTRFVLCSLLFVSCGSSGGGRIADSDAASTPDAPAAGPPDAPDQTTDALVPPPLQPVIVWPEGLMSPNGPLYRVTPVDVSGNGFPTQFALTLPAPPPQDVLNDLASRGWHAVMANIAAVRAGSIDSSGYVGACEVWGYTNDVLFYMTEAGAWLSSQYGFNDPTVYSQGYHLFAVRIVDAAPCSDPMCPGPQAAYDEVPLDSRQAIELRNPDEWCH
jgi:hypothetical protein